LIERKQHGQGRIDPGLHLKNLMAFATDQSRFLTVGSLTVEVLQKAWKDTCEGMNFALNFLRSNLEIDSPALLSSPPSCWWRWPTSDTAATMR
jgi:hypothetical protein